MSPTAGRKAITSSHANFFPESPESMIIMITVVMISKTYRMVNMVRSIIGYTIFPIKVADVQEVTFTLT